MTDYSSDINIALYKYSEPVYITEPTGERQTFIPLKLNLNQHNFNFDLARSDGLDFRLAERSNGTGVFQMWIAYWSYSSRQATIWFKLLEILGIKQLATVDLSICAQSLPYLVYCPTIK